MTANQLPDLTDPEYESLPLYEVIKNLSIETEKPVGLWLFRIAQAAYIEAELLTDDSIVPLRLRPDEKWGITETEVKEVLKPRKPNWVNSIHTHPDHPTVAKRERVQCRTPWSIKKSVLTLFLSKNNTAPTNEQAWKGMDKSLVNEGVHLHRSDFRDWCLASGYSLPRFWFSDTEPQRASGELTNPARTHSPNTGHTRTRTDAMKALILKLTREGSPTDLESVWLALLSEKGKPGSCIVSGVETEDGPVIRWRTSTAEFRNLSKKALAQRLKILFGPHNTAK